MGKAFTQVTMEERCEIARLRSQGSSVRQIAAGVDRPPSTVARELKRNDSRTLGYQPSYANQQAHARRWRGSRLERDGPLREQVLAGLGAGWSPAQVAGRLALDEGRLIISHESIYRFIYAQMARKKDYSWRHYLPRAKAKRGFRGRRDGSPVTHIAHRVPLSQRPRAAADRATFGHWEGDLMHFGNHGPALLALAERHSRLVLLARLPGKGADVTADTIARLLAPLPPAWRQTITFDNGTEFARHYRLHALGIQTFFCDTRSPWQKGGVENAIGRLRRPLPRKTRLADLSEAAFTRIIQLYNNTPRKCLGYRTPAESLDDQVLHLECELTFPLSRERRYWWVVVRWGLGMGDGDGPAPRTCPGFPLSRERRYGWRGNCECCWGLRVGALRQAQGERGFGARACDGVMGDAMRDGDAPRPAPALGSRFRGNDGIGGRGRRVLLGVEGEGPSTGSGRTDLGGSRAMGGARGPFDGLRANGFGRRRVRWGVRGGGGWGTGTAPRRAPALGSRFRGNDGIGGWGLRVLLGVGGGVGVGGGWLVGFLGDGWLVVVAQSRGDAGRSQLGLFGCLVFLVANGLTEVQYFAVI